MKHRWLHGVLAVAVVFGIATYFGSTRTEQPGRAFALIDSNGARVTDRSFHGHWLIVYFGFTHCTDVCPVHMLKLSKALEVLGAQAAQVRVAFITVDPERDSAQVLHSYLRGFGPKFTGLTGTQPQIDAAEQTFRAYAEKRPAAADGSYAMNHSSSFYVLDPNGHFRRQISAEAGIPDLAATLRSAMQ